MEDKSPTNNSSNNPPSPAIATGPKIHWRSKVSLAIVILIVAVCVVGAVYYNHRSSVNHQPPNPSAASIVNLEAKGLYSFKYSGKTVPYTVAGQSAGQGISFDKPSEFIGPNSGSATQQVLLSHSINLKGIIKPFGEINAISFPLSALTPSNLVSLAADLAAKPSSPSYISSVTALQYYIQSRLGGNYKATYSPAKTFSSPVVKANAWSMDFSATTKKTISGTIQPDLGGRIVMAVGTKGFYYLMISAPTSNWTDNQKLWDQVFNSLKIDL